MKTRDPLERLDDYVTGTMPDAEASAFEEELFGAAARGEAEDARWFERFHLLMSWFAQGDVLIRGATAEDVEALRRGGLNVQVIEAASGATVPFVQAKGAEIIVTAVSCDVRGYESVEATIENPDGRVLHTFRDCLPDPKTGNLYAICAANLAVKAWGGGPRVARVTGMKDGKREEIAVFSTTPAPP